MQRSALAAENLLTSLN